VRLLVTRPEPDAQRTAAALVARGHEAIVASLLQIEASPDADLGPGPWSAVLITSANAVHAVTGHNRIAELRTAPVFAVGRRSAEAARAAGFADVTSADGDVADLARLVRARVAASARVLYLAGEERSGDLAGELAGFEVRTITTYRAVGAAALPRVAHEALAAGGIGGVLHYSRRSAGIYVDAARAAGLLAEALAPAHYCIAAQVAEPLAAAGATDIRIAARPEEQSLLALVDRA
jgi:uroporphyrinogen-III synthase